MSEKRVLTDEQRKHAEQLRNAREQIKRRKERTRRLIIRGAIAEKAIEGAEMLSHEDFQRELYRRMHHNPAAIDPGHPQDSRGSDPR